ncbi:sensor histidine kinase [Streptomyces litchfieldiae]|uniref:histidine kinase n=1 Tax=Streptomyces litchfieldiae TaxID=3075543 RepID=A0ABU2MVV4_9ACTN|nr:histidine kinase [Streptomyces sp. DSM 44938]MDT0345767.1 histidine kinase [Streptomyces sp. DSM 44938]
MRPSARPLLAAAVVAADTAILAAARPNGLPAWALGAFALAATLIVAAERRGPLAAFGATVLLLSPVTGAGFALLLWTGYRAGHAITSRATAARTVGIAAGGLAAQAAAHGIAPRTLLFLAWFELVFVVLPLLSGRYLAQHRRLVETLLQERRLLAERERLRERLRIARDMHDSLGRRLSLVSIQAAALEVSDRLPPRERETTRQLAAAAREAMAELHELVGALRSGETTFGPEAIERLVGDFRAAAVEVAFRREGTPVELPDATWEAAYRVVEEGLTNAAKHAPGRPVTVRMAWERDALLLTIVNPAGPPAAGRPGGGHGLAGLRERARAVGGFVDHGPVAEGFRLLAMLPAAPAAPRPPAPAAARRLWLAAATGVLAFGVLPASLLLGGR